MRMTSDHGLQVFYKLMITKNWRSSMILLPPKIKHNLKLHIEIIKSWFSVKSMPKLYSALYLRPY